MKKVIAYVHSHWDREWYRDFESFRIRLVEVFDNVLEMLKKNTLPCFYFDGQTSALEDYLEIRPENKSIVKKFIKEKKLFVGPFYCLSDVFLISAEGLIKNLELGINQSEKLGCTQFTGYLADTFGHSKSMPYIFKHFNINDMFMWRGLPDLPSEFMWNGIKATNLVRGYFNDIFSANLSLDKKVSFLQDNLDKIADKSSNVLLMPIGADHLGVPQNLQDEITEINKKLKGYKIVLASPFDYLKEVSNNYKTDVIGELRDNSKTFILPSVYSTRIYLKQENSFCDWTLNRITEPLQAFANKFYGVKPFQAQIDYATKLWMQNHAHDSIYGCSIDAVHQEMMTRFKKVKSVLSEIKNKTVYEIYDDSKNVSVFNLSNFKYSGAVEIKTEKKLSKNLNVQNLGYELKFTDKKLQNTLEIPVTEDVTKIYKYLIDVENLQPFSVQNIKNTSKKSDLKVADNLIENKNIKLFIKNNKINIENKKTNEIFEDAINIIDSADVGDSYNFAPIKNDIPVIAKFVKSKILLKGHIRSILRLEYQINIPKTSDEKRSKKCLLHKIFVDVILENQSEFLKFDVFWENKSENHILQIQFNSKKNVENVISEDTTGLITRKFDNNYELANEIPAQRGIELKQNTAPFQRFFKVDDFGVITKGLNEYEVNKKGIALTILRSVGIISTPKNPSRGTPAGPPLKTPEMQCLGDCKAEFALSFEPEIFEYYRLAEFYYNPAVTVEAKKENQIFIENDNKKILVSSVKIKDNKLVARFINQSDKSEKTSINGKKYTFEPYEIKNIIIL